MPRPRPTPSPDAPQPLDLPLKLTLARLANGMSPASLAQAYSDWLMHLLVSPSHQARLAASAGHKALAWWWHVARALAGTCEDCVAPAPNDKRFSRPDWQLPPFHALSQAFLLQQQWWDEAASGVRGVSRHHEEMMRFVLRQWLDMLSPSNFPATNPEVMRATLASGGRNLAQGMSNWARDALAVASGGRPRGVQAFQPGRTVAVTPGQVVMRNHLVELIQYTPTTPRVWREPVLVVPSWIMKYYILDLTPDDSLVRYLVGQGHTVFMVSWRNPDAQDADLGLDDYLRQGVLEPLQAVRALCPDAAVHAAGYCLGGTLLAMAAAWLQARGEQPLRTVSLLAAQVDFQEPGELGLFIDESQIAFLEDVMAGQGFFDGRRMAGAFQLINSRDLVWSRLVHEYLMGATSPVTPMRAWNADATRLPARMHSEYLRRLYLHNDLAEGRYRADGQTLDLDRLRLPMFVVATEADHVSPWRSVYKLLHLSHAPTDFVLTSGGHNVGIVNPPQGPLAFAGASYRHEALAPRAAPADPQDWYDRAAVQPGSWWPHWHRWLAAHSTPRRIAARHVAGARLPGGAVAAPGTYVHQG